MMIEGSDKRAVHRDFVILGRSKERSDAAQTLGSMPLPQRSAAVQTDAPYAVRSKANTLDRLYPPANVTEWILGSARRFALLRPRMTKAKVVGLRFAPAILSPWGRGGGPAHG
ncbi:hypothetical protein Mesau_03372 [Mesorhizobium australicum WSM2073]|uniref:Uncharacterized protein n=1 Tax=Mesorhizobium australicum (strain HAMBI 3006 / LMG 24608 / WSM2073) TaxID=754035 RepID=L0KNZ3_MESAW|nr:hypothetical protein Mesau_03372 [Mesorhizobium australicum WSM2073]